ncbi:MFS transporter [Photobacterium sp. CCB-ST2H9]|uniref:MFS transporter n=1 Tax=unclassified Photobacterium TaxID=2628852 RepID=UPI002003E446|nr:MFS transporter [Photobacterium sp. CCB-ST2H9]UTM58182.1 MFS transporter [Photobacterium sp. CCB-ST2H9]
MLSQSNRIVILLSCTLVLMAQMATTLYLPALPQVAGELAISRHSAELSISLFVIGAALPVIYWGHAAEKYGRKRSLSMALIVFITASLVLYFTQSLESLLIARVIQGAGAGGAAIIARIIVRDYWHGDALTQKLSLLSMAFIAALGIGQFIGSLLTQYSDWRIGFLILSSIAAFSLLAITQLQLQGPAQSDQQKPKSSASYMQIVKDRGFLIPCTQGGLGFATIVTLQEVSPFIFDHDLQLSGQLFGFFGLAIGVTYFLGSLYVKRYVTKVGSQQLMNRGAYILLTGALLMLTIWLFSESIPGQILVGSYIALYLLIIFGQAVIFPNSMSLAASNSAHSGAHSIALCGFLQQSMAGVAAALAVGAGHSHSWTYWVAIMGVVIFTLGFTRKEQTACLN